MTGPFFRTEPQKRNASIAQQIRSPDTFDGECQSIVKSRQASAIQQHNFFIL